MGLRQMMLLPRKRIHRSLQRRSKDVASKCLCCEKTTVTIADDSLPEYFERTSRKFQSFEFSLPTQPHDVHPPHQALRVPSADYMAKKAALQSPIRCEPLEQPNCVYANNLVERSESRHSIVASSG